MLSTLSVLLAGSVDTDGQQYAQMVLLQNANDSTSRPLVHFSQSEPQVLRDNEVSEVISRILGTSSAVSPGLNRRLPSGDLLNRPAANLLLTVDYFQQGKTEAPVMTTMINSNKHYKILVEESQIGADIPAALKESIGDSKQPLVMCVSASEEAASNTCDEADILSWNTQQGRDSFVAEVKEQQQEHAVFKLLGSFIAHGGSAKVVTTESGSPGLSLSKGSSSVVFDLSNEADMVLFLELHTMASLPERLSENSSIMDESPDFFSLTVASLKTLAKSYGDDSLQYKMGVSVVDSAIKQVVENFEKLMPNRLVSQVVLMEDMHEPVAATSRRLLQAATVTAYKPLPPIAIGECLDYTADGEPCPPTLGEIERVQMFFWTMVILIIMLLMSTCCLCNMDIGRDSLLYAKFITEAKQE